MTYEWFREMARQIGREWNESIMKEILKVPEYDPYRQTLDGVPIEFVAEKMAMGVPVVQWDAEGWHNETMEAVRRDMMAEFSRGEEDRMMDDLLASAVNKRPVPPEEHQAAGAAAEINKAPPLPGPLDYQALRLETAQGELVEVVPWPHRRAPAIYVMRHGRLFHMAGVIVRQSAVFIETDEPEATIRKNFQVEELK